MRTLADGTIKILTDLDASGFQKGISKLGSIASTGLKATTAAIAAAGGAIAGLLGASVKTGMDFEQQMSRVNAISGATAEEFAALEKQAIDLGASTAFSATEAAEGMENLASAGFSTTEIMAAMPGMLDLAASSGADLAQSADIAASTLRGFGLEAADAGHVADVLAKTAADTNAAVEDTGEAMKYVAPVAHAFGISMEETAAAIGIMSDAGIKGSQAGTTLRGALSRLAKPTDVMQDTMDALGISFFNAEGKMLSLTEMTAMLKDKTAGLTDEQRNAALVTLFGQESLSGMLALMEAGPEKIGSLTASLENCDGAAAEMAETMMDNLAGAVEELSGAAETLGILVYQSIQEPLKEVVQTATEYIGQLQSAFEEGGLQGAVSELGTIFADVAVQIAQAAPDLASAAVSLLDAFLQGLSDAVPAVSTAAVEIVTTLLNGLFEILPQLPQIAGDLIENLGTSLASAAPTLIPSAVSCIMQFAQGLVDQLPTILSVGLQLVRGIADGILNALPVLIESLPQLLTGIMTFLVEAIPQIIETIIYIVEAIVAQLPTIISALIEALPLLIEALISGLIGCIGQLVAGAVQLVVLLVTHLPEIIAALIEAIPQIVEALIAGFTESLPAFEEAGKTVMDALKTGVEEIWEKIKAFFTEAIPNLIDSIGEWFSELPGRVKQWLDDTLQKIQDWASNMDGKAEEAGEACVTAVVDVVKTLPGKVWTWLLNTISKVSSFVSNFSEKASEAGQEFFDNIVDKVREIPGEMLSIGGDIVRGIWNGIQSLSGWLWNQVAGFARGILNGVKSALGIHSPSKIMQEEVGRFLPPGISAGFADALPAAERSMEKQLGAVTDHLSGVSVPAIVHASMDTATLGALRTAVELKTAQTSASVLGDPTGTAGKLAALADKVDALLARLDAYLNANTLSPDALLAALMGLRVELDGVAVGRMVTPAVNERLNDLYDLEERGRF